MITYQELTFEDSTGWWKLKLDTTTDDASARLLRWDEDDKDWEQIIHLENKKSRKPRSGTFFSLWAEIDGKHLKQKHGELFALLAKFYYQKGPHFDVYRGDIKNRLKVSEIKHVNKLLNDFVKWDLIGVVPLTDSLIQITLR